MTDFTHMLYDRAAYIETLTKDDKNQDIFKNSQNFHHSLILKLIHNYKEIQKKTNQYPEIANVSLNWVKN